MKIYCNRTELNKALNTVSHSVPSRTTSPILEGILFETLDEKLKLTATDTNITIETTLSAEVDSSKANSFVVPAKLCTSIVSKLPEEEIMLDYDEDNKKLKIKSGGFRSEIICFDSDVFPKLILNEGNNVINLPKEDVKNIIKKTAFSASTDEYNGILTGVLLEINNGLMKMVAVDPFRIATYSVEIVSDANMNVVIPAKFAIDVSKIISDDGDEIMSLEIVDNKVVLRFDNNKVIINTFSGKYIDYEKILSNVGDISIRVKRDDLLKGIDRASILTTSQNNNLIKFNITDELITINSLSEAGNIEEQIEIIKEGGDIDIGMNSKYLKDALSSIEDEEILINMNDSVSPCIIKPLKGEKYIYLVLPIRIN